MTVESSMYEEVKPETMSMRALGEVAVPVHEQLCIFGTGDLGRSLGLRLLQSGYRVVYGSRRPNSCGPLPEGAQVMSHAAAARSASLIFICVHREHYGFLQTMAPHLDGKVLVDLSNNLKKGVYPEANAAYLQRDVIYEAVEKGNDISFRIMISLANKVFPIVSLIMLSLCYLPGVIAAFLQLYRGTKYRRFPDWLDRWMLCRKQMGLVALGLAFLHAIYTFIIPIRYAVRHKLISRVVDEMKNNKTTPFFFDNTEAWGTDSFLVLGILGFFLYVLLGLTSLPSVGGTLSWREFSFIQSKLGHLTLFICTSHGYIYGWNKFLRPSTYKWYTPPGYMLCLIVPSVVLVLKFLLLLPCVDRTLTRIRQGWERTQPGKELIMTKATNL
ncbi:metalloreductase STEAP4-like isoform 2-T2 [Tautogolabrus adspersus]